MLESVINTNLIFVYILLFVFVRYGSAFALKSVGMQAGAYSDLRGTLFFRNMRYYLLGERLALFCLIFALLITYYLFATYRQTLERWFGSSNKFLLGELGCSGLLELVFVGVIGPFLAPWLFLRWSRSPRNKELFRKIRELHKLINRHAVSNARLALENKKKKVSYINNHNADYDSNFEHTEFEKMRIMGIIDRSQYDLMHTVNKSDVMSMINYIDTVKNIKEMTAISSSQLALWFHHEIVAYFMAQIQKKFKEAASIKISRYYLIGEKDLSHVIQRGAFEYDEFEAIKHIHRMGNIDLWLYWFSDENQEHVPKYNSGTGEKKSDSSFVILWKNSNMKKVVESIWSFRYEAKGHGFLKIEGSTEPYEEFVNYLSKDNSTITEYTEFNDFQTAYQECKLAQNNRTAIKVQVVKNE